jgi:TatD DNase family protein
VNMRLVDTHCHLYADDFKDDLEDSVARSIEAGVDRVLLPNIDIVSIPAMLSLQDRFPENMFSMMGLHPCDVKEDFNLVLTQMHKKYLENRALYCGIGEIGMDLHWDKTTEAWQIEALITQVEWAVEYNLPVSLHTRNATQKVIELLKPYKGKITGVFHSFTESEELAQEIIKLGFYLGIGGVSTFKKAGVKELVAKIGLDRVVLETDSPYLAPVPKRGKRNEPAYTRYIAENLATVLDMPLSEVAKITTANAQSVFHLMDM